MCCMYVCMYVCLYVCMYVLLLKLSVNNHMHYISTYIFSMWVCTFIANEF